MIKKLPFTIRKNSLCQNVILCCDFLVVNNIFEDGFHTQDLKRPSLLHQCKRSYVLNDNDLTSWDCMLLALYSCRMMTSHSLRVGGRGGCDWLHWIIRGCREVMNPALASEGFSILPAVGAAEEFDLVSLHLL